MSEREAAREILRELLHEALAGGNGHHGDTAGGVPTVPAPPVAAVLRPSTWGRPPAHGELIGDGASGPGRAGDDGSSGPGRAGDDGSSGPGRAGDDGSSGPGRVGDDAAGRGIEWVTLDSDVDLDRFVRALLARFENPRERTAIRNGRLRFELRRAGAGGPPAGPAAGTVRVARGAVTERKVEEAAKAGARLVLGPGAVLTPLAREKARASGIEIERER